MTQLDPRDRHTAAKYLYVYKGMYICIYMHFIYMYIHTCVVWYEGIYYGLMHMPSEGGKGEFSCPTNFSLLNEVFNMFFFCRQHLSRVLLFFPAPILQDLLYYFTTHSRSDHREVSLWHWWPLPSFLFIINFSKFRLYEDIDAILANVILNNLRQDREGGYGGKWGCRRRMEEGVAVSGDAGGGGGGGGEYWKLYNWFDMSVFLLDVTLSPTLCLCCITCLCRFSVFHTLPTGVSCADALVIVLSAITSHIRVAQVSSMFGHCKTNCLFIFFLLFPPLPPPPLLPLPPHPPHPPPFSQPVCYH